MRAVTLDEVPADPSVTDVADPDPQAGELLVKVAGSSINGFDAATAAGYLQEVVEHRFPLVIGKDFAGMVAAVGQDVTGFAIGDTVFGVVMKPYLGTGSLAEYVTVPAGTGVAHIPAGLTESDAGALGLAGTTALDSVDAAGIESGDIVLISGATGGVGAIAVQYAALRGATVIATARPGPEHDFVNGLTAANIEPVDYTGDLAAQVRVIAPRGVDAVLHFAGDGAQLTKLLRPGGRIASTLGFGPDFVKDQDATAVVVVADTDAAALHRVAADAAAGTIRVPVTAVFPLEDAPQAFSAFRSGAVGKIAVSMM